MKKVIAGFVAATGMFLAVQSQALTLGPADTTCYGSDVNGQDIPEFIEGCFTPAITAADIAELEQLYKNNVETGDETTPFSDSYDTEYFNEPDDPEDALITYVGGAAMNCVDFRCFLFIKDGNQTPTSYAFEITGWNGTDDIELLGFWPQQGAISHVEIWGGLGDDDGDDDQDLPEPGSLALLGLGLMGLGLARRRRTQ